MSSNKTVFGFLMGWAVIILFLVGISKTQLGYKAIYYVLWLSVAILLVTNYQFFEKLYGTPAANSAAQQLGAGQK